MNDLKLQQYRDLSDYFEECRKQVASFNLVDEVKVYQAFLQKLRDQAAKDAKRYERKKK